MQLRGGNYKSLLTTLACYLLGGQAKTVATAASLRAMQKMVPSLSGHSSGGLLVERGCQVVACFFEGAVDVRLGWFAVLFVDLHCQGALIAVADQIAATAVVSPLEILFVV